MVGIEGVTLYWCSSCAQTLMASTSCRLLLTQACHLCCSSGLCGCPVVHHFSLGASVAKPASRAQACQACPLRSMMMHHPRLRRWKGLETCWTRAPQCRAHAARDAPRPARTERRRGPDTAPARLLGGARRQLPVLARVPARRTQGAGRIRAPGLLSEGPRAPCTAMWSDLHSPSCCQPSRCSVRAAGAGTLRACARPQRGAGHELGPSV